MLSICPVIEWEIWDRDKRAYGSMKNIKLTMTLHDREELDDDLRGRTNEDLALATALGIDDVVLRIRSAYPATIELNATHQAVVKDRNANHGG